MHISSKLLHLANFFFKYLTLPWLAITASTLSAGEFEEGDYFATGFEVRQNGKILFDDTMVYRLESGLQIQRVSSDHYKFTVSAEIQQTKKSKVLRERRVDQFRGPCHNKPPCLRLMRDLVTQLCPILYPFAISKPVKRSSNLR